MGEAPTYKQGALKWTRSEHSRRRGTRQPFEVQSLLRMHCTQNGCISGYTRYEASSTANLHSTNTTLDTTPRAIQEQDVIQLCGMLNFQYTPPAQHSSATNIACRRNIRKIAQLAKKVVSSQSTSIVLAVAGIVVVLIQHLNSIDMITILLLLLMGAHFPWIDPTSLPQQDSQA